MSQDFPTNAPQLTSVFKQQFHDTFNLEAQQKEFRLVASVDNRGKI